VPSKHDPIHPPPFVSDDNVQSSTCLSNIRTHRDHPIDLIIGNLNEGVRTRTTSNFCLYVNFMSMVSTEKIHLALLDADWIRAMQEKLK